MRLHRHIVLVALGAAFLALTCAAPAMAVSQNSGYSGWTSGTPMPHGGYTTTTTKCAICHAVHAASNSGQVLLRSSVAEACTYCHVDNTFGLTPLIYGGNVNNYSQADTSHAHNWYFDATANEYTGTKCTSCHQVHQATQLMTNNTYLTSKLLQGPKVQDQYAWPPPYDPRITDAPNDTDPDNETALTKWCTQCHKPGGVDGAMYGYYTTGYNEETHIMKNGGDIHPAAGVAVAWAGSNYCSSCHSRGYGTADWPHYTDSTRFLESGANTNTAGWGAVQKDNVDGICLRCHFNGTNGVSRTF